MVGVTFAVALALVSGRAVAAEFVNDDVSVSRILELADQRLAVMPAVAAAKWETHAPIFDPPREDAVIQRAQDLGAAMGLSSESVKSLFALQTRLAREVQAGLYEEWKAHGLTSADPVVSLASLRPKLDQLTVDLLQAVYIAVPVLQKDGFASHYSALAEQQLRSRGWTDQNRAELLDVLHSVHTDAVPPVARIESSGVLRVGVTGDYAPFSLEANGSLSGADIELAQELASQLHAHAVFVRTSWTALSDDLSNGEFDVGMGGVSITPAREARGAFSVPYVSGGKTILSRCKDVRKFGAGLAAVDKAKVRIIVNPGGTNEQYVRANVHRATIIVFPDNHGVFDELIAGHADVMITDDVEAELQSHRHPGLCRAYPGTLSHADKAIFMPRDAQLVKAVNDWLMPAIAAGEPARLLRKYLN